jgi:hypothetical protein
MTDLHEILKQIAVDERNPCTYSGGFGIEIVPGAEVVEARLCRPFIPRRFIFTRPGIKIRSVYISCEAQIQVSYDPAGLVSDVLLPLCHPIEFSGIRMCPPGMALGFRLWNVTEPTTIIVLGETAR